MREDVGDERQDLVRTKVGGWASELVDLSAGNPLLRFEGTKAASLDLVGCAPAALEDLLSGDKIRLGSLFRQQDAYDDACLRAMSLHRKAVTLHEELGVDLGRIAQGFVSGGPLSGVAAPTEGLRAPLLLRPVAITPRTTAGNEFLLEAGDECDINPVLLHALNRCGLGIDAEWIKTAACHRLSGQHSPGERLRAVYAQLADLAAERGIRLELEESAAIGLFNDVMLPAVEDLTTATGLLVRHDLVAAMAGDEIAKQRVRAHATAYVPPCPDDIDPADEHLVLDADSYQQDAINAALAGHHVVLDGPPGTGRTQTIANIIAGAAAKGERVLFVAKKRAAIEAVTERLAGVGLDRLVFDPHRHGRGNKDAGAALADNLGAVIGQPPVETAYVRDRLVAHRDAVRAHAADLHEVRPPWGMSAYQVQAELLELGTYYRTPHKFRGQALRALDSTTVGRLEEQLSGFVKAGGLRVLRGDTPWANASVRDQDDVRRVLAELDELTGKTVRQTRDGMRGLLNQTGLAEPRDLAGWRDVLELLEDVSASVRAFGAGIFGISLDRGYRATLPRTRRKSRPERVGWLERRRLIRQTRAATGATDNRSLHEVLSAVLAQRDRWRRLGGAHTQPCEVVGLDDVLANYAKLRERLDTVATCAGLPKWESTPTEQLDKTLAELSWDRQILSRIPEINSLRVRFESLGLGALLADLAGRDVSAQRAWRYFRHAWLESLLDEFRSTAPSLGDFDPDRQGGLVDAFRQADVEHIRAAAPQVRGEVARRLRHVQDRHRDQADVLRGQADKSRGRLAMRRLVEQCPDMLLALHPCWAMSPLMVSRTLPARGLFDIVVFDEASRIQPAEASTSIMRGSRVLVAGDDESVESEYSQSVLTTLRPIISARQRLRWHHRSRDERLVAFANRETYRGRMSTLPGVSEQSPITLDVGGDAVRRVVRAVLEHAERRPEETLGVITIGREHARTIDRAVREALAGRGDLEAFFAENACSARRFFVKDLETVQGDTRDAIILAVGATRSASGAISRASLAPLHRPCGERRLNIAVTRAKRRMMVISSFGAHDLEVDTEAPGTESLRRFLDFAARGGGLGDVRRRLSVRLDGFESDVVRVLEQRGITAVPQWGQGRYRVDFALPHPRNPGRMVLAVQADGAGYRDSRSTRDRDRLRQAQLESLGWRVHRLWSSAWFMDRAREAAKIESAWRGAMAGDDRAPEPVETAELAIPRPRPELAPGLAATDYSKEELVALSRWLLAGSTRLDMDVLLERAMGELGIEHGDSELRGRLEESMRIARRLAAMPRD